MQYAEEFAKEKGFKMIFLKLWSIKRDTWLHHWYMKQGYVFHEDDVFDFWMRKDI
jgi:TfoX/Sxy family transcriptional regulator of competence genes